jgi:diguanylate cyclase (GGDEF)-like protein
VTVALDLLPLLQGAVPQSLKLHGVWPMLGLTSFAVFIAAMLAIREPPLDADIARRIGMWGMIPAMVITVLTGGLQSPGVVLVALCALAISVPHGPGMALVGSLAAMTTLLGMEALLTKRIVWAPSFLAASVLVSTAVIPRWLAGRMRRMVDAAERRAQAVEELAQQGRAGPPAPDRPEPTGAYRTGDPVGTPVINYLRMMRDNTGADEAVIWRPRHDEPGTLVPWAWSGDGADGPDSFRTEEWLPLVAWAVEQGRPNFDGSGGMPNLAAAPIPPRIGAIGGGAVSLSHRSGMRVDRDELKRWLPRHADHLADMMALVESGDEVARQNATTLALLQAATDFQKSRSIETLGAEICQSALDVTGAAHAALVRWDADTRKGEVQATSPNAPVRMGLVVTEDSAVGGSCREATPLTWEDARELSRVSVVYGRAEPRRSVASLGVVPLVRPEGVVGAIVVEGDDVNRVRGESVRALRLLGAIAAVSLESQFEYEEIERRARTDALTGLANRRHFEEQIERLLDECDRYGGPVSLVVADLDHFKQVNDSYGHDVGDVVLQHVAGLFKDGVRTVDIVTRYGGEEIACILPQTDLQGAREFAERMRRTIEGRSVVARSHTITVTCSLGVATYGGEHKVPRDQLFSSADRALYRSKQAGRNRVSAHDASDSSPTT